MMNELQIKNDIINSISILDKYKTMENKAKRCAKNVKPLKRKFTVIENEKGEQVIKNHNGHSIGFLSSGALPYLNSIKKKNINFFLQGGTYSFSYFDFFYSEVATLIPDEYDGVILNKELKTEILEGLIFNFLNKYIFK